MDDKDLKRQNYAQWLRQQRALERELARVDKEEWGLKEQVHIKTTQEYLKLPETPPIELAVLPEEEAKNRKKHDKPYQNSLYKPKRSREKAKKKEREYDDYWEKYGELDENGKRVKPINTDTKAERYERTKAYNRAYYHRNKEKCKKSHDEWMEENKEKMREYHREYARKRRQKEIEEENKKYQEVTVEQPKGDWHLRQPSVFRVVITENGCNTCGDKSAVYLFKNDNKEYTGCLCQKCLNTYKFMEQKETDWIFKIREYLRNRNREAHERTPKR